MVQLLHSSTTIIPQCVAMCFIVKPLKRAYPEQSIMSEPMLLQSPLATVSNDQLFGAVRELAGYVSASLTAATMGEQSSVSAKLFEEDEKQLSHTQIYRPLNAHGVALHYRFIRDDNLLNTLSHHLLAANNAGGADTSSKIELKSAVDGILFCVGLSGLSIAHASSSLYYSLTQRMIDSLTLLSNLNPKETAAVKGVLSTFLLMDDEQRKTDEMVKSPEILMFQATTTKSDDNKTALGLIPPLAGTLSRRRMTGTHTGKDLEDEGSKGFLKNVFISGGAHVSLDPSSADVARSVSEQLRVLSITETDTVLQKYKLTAQERKSKLDLTSGSKSRFNRRKPNTRGVIRDPDFDNFDYRGPDKLLPTKRDMASAPQNATIEVEAGMASRSAVNQKRVGSSKMQVPALAAAPTDVGHSRRASMVSGSHFSSGQRAIRGHQKNAVAQFVGGDLERHGEQQRRRRSSNGRTFVDDASNVSDGRSSAAQGQLQVNIALNEDLSCSYKLSQLSSCSVEGVIQVQVISNSRATGPFRLILRDPSHHIESLQENKKFADDWGKGHESDFRYDLDLPKGDTYTPVVRYKCASSLRPVPLRVQTRVKSDGEFCRVALQISSNPNNYASLSDLTIIMGVPEEVIGETLITQPEGGVWNESKRSVIWCVSELGSGEKFQLQARFELGDVPYDIDVEKPKFPVLVRCQCLFAQLSSIEIDVRDIPEVLPADIEMKLAKRFRLAHRERA